MGPGKRMIDRKLLLLGLLTGITSCSGGGGDGGGLPGGDDDSQIPPSGACLSFHDAGGQVTSSIDPACGSCSATSTSAAADGDAETYAALSVNGASNPQGASIRATAQQGTTFPAGQLAGAFMSIPAGTGQSYSYEIRSYLGGVLQEVLKANSAQAGVSGGASKAYLGAETTKAFDAIEVFVSNTQAGGTPEFDVYEVCWNRT